MVRMRAQEYAAGLPEILKSGESTSGDPRPFGAQTTGDYRSIRYSNPSVMASV